MRKEKEQEKDNDKSRKLEISDREEEGKNGEEGRTKEAGERVFGTLYLTTSRVLIANRGMKVEREDGWRGAL